MKHANPVILVVNGGSSSIRFALYAAEPVLRELMHGKVDRIGLSGANITVIDADGSVQYAQDVDADNQVIAVSTLLAWLQQQPVFSGIVAVGHRVVHGMEHSAAQRVTPELLDALRRITPFDPEHMAVELQLIEAMQQCLHTCMHIVCFDTAFHRSMPRIAKLLPIPRRYQTAGIERYGFHGLSYEYLMEELTRLDARSATGGRAILAHLGNGASLAAVCNGVSVDTSMGFTPASGLMMSTRSGDLDPGLVYFLAQTQNMSARQFQTMVNHQSGLLGVSEVSADIRDLLACEEHDVAAAEAIALFCYQVKKWIGSFAAVLGGVDTLVFTGGIGENAPIIRERICAGLEFLGIQMDSERNLANAALISADASTTVVRVIPTNEELMIARAVSRQLATTGNAESQPLTYGVPQTDDDDIDLKRGSS
ncbi:MAG: acetate/propionate family kinase [Halioglobus sp.]